MCYRRLKRLEHHVHYVKANLLPWHFGLMSIFAGGANQAGLFLESDGTVRRTVLMRLVRFDFDEDQRIAFPANQIHFTSPGCRPVIAIHDDNSDALQEPLGNVLAAPAEGVVFGRVPPARLLPEEFCEFKKLVGHNASLWQ